MKVDISALRKFEDTFGPAIAAIPAVIDAVSKANDFDRYIAQKKQELEAVEQQISKTKADGEDFLKRTQERGDAIIKSADDYAAAAVAASDAEKAKVKESLDVLNGQINKAHESVFIANQKRKEAEEVMAKRMAELDAAHNVKVKQLESQIEDLEARRAKAEKALATLKAKLEA